MPEMQYTLERRSLAEQVAAHIKNLILSGQLASGQRISEEKLAEEFNISRTPVREALRRLENYGLVKIKPRTYAEVEKITHDEARQVAEVRAKLERLAAGLTAQKATEEDILALTTAASECKARVQSGDLGAVFEKDSAFHLEIAARCGNKYLYDILSLLDAKIMLYRLTFCLTMEKVAADVACHDRIIAAISKHNADEAADIIEQHTLGMKQQEALHG